MHTPQPKQPISEQPRTPSTPTAPPEPEHDRAYDHYLDLIDFGRQVAAEVAVCAGHDAGWML